MNSLMYYLRFAVGRPVGSFTCSAKHIRNTAEWKMRGHCFSILASVAHYLVNVFLSVFINTHKWHFAKPIPPKETVYSLYIQPRFVMWNIGESSANVAEPGDDLLAKFVFHAYLSPIAAFT